MAMLISDNKGKNCYLRLRGIFYQQFSQFVIGDNCRHISTKKQGPGINKEKQN